MLTFHQYENYNPGNTFRWNFIQNLSIYIKENVSQDAIRKMAAILLKS